MSETTKLVDAIGVPALFEQMAEECVELGHACLKYARYLVLSYSIFSPL